MPLADLAESVWYGDTVPSRLARAALSPASAVYGAVVAQVNMMSAMNRAKPGPIPAISIGNITVGGTGKTPVSAWFAQRFRADGASPAIVLRGYGDDEMHVHRLLNPEVPVFVGADRVTQVQRAAAGGADLAILDDAFQHRKAHRVADVVLVSADRWTGDVRLLPAGPFREPLRALRRATLVMLTVKAALDDRVRSAEAAIRTATGSTVVTVDLNPASFIAVKSETVVSLEAWSRKRVLAVSGIGDPAAFTRQLERLGLLPIALSFADHHTYDQESVARILVAARDLEAVVCTLKDAVKLEKLWPDSAIPLWYLSQSVVPRDGTEALDDVVRSVLEARRITPSSPDPLL
ncbi:MAG: tetraacyldisaccharide 4'-kinase [Gemmatimonadaceae bacterium]|nr:tetraacyldisaccharide 4'-kinase [Gemmatimonadaceae bacterium]